MMPCVAGVRRKLGRIARAAAIPILCLSVAFFATLQPAEARSTARYASIVIDADSGAVLQESNADSQTYPASLTKMMTLYLLFETLRQGKLGLDDTLTATSHAAAQPATHLSLDAGDKITVEQAIHAVIVRSANDVAVVIAESLAGSESDFARLMTAKARRLGMAETTFRNASGLPDPGQKTTARDMATLARALVQDFPQYYHYFADYSFTYKGRHYVGHNRILKKYDGADGLKTGYIRASGYNLATSAVRDGHRLIGVVLGGKSAASRDAQMAKLLDRGFAKAGTSAVQVASSLKSTLKSGLVKVAETAETDGEPAVIEAAAPAAKRAKATLTAPAPVPALADETATNLTTGAWGVQVGAYSRFSPASLAAQQAFHKAPKYLRNARVAIDESPSSNGGKLYRARLVGLDQRTAQAACRQLKAKKTACLVLQTDLSMASAGSAQ